MHQFVSFYQPIVEIWSGQVVGFEALARKVEPDGSVRSVGFLVESMEADPEQLFELIRTMLGCIKQDILALFQRHPGFYISINIPPVVLGTGKVFGLLHEFELVPISNRLVCEITERQVLTDLGRSALEMARTAGIAVAIDDFGTGNSGVQQIAGMDFDILKIDRSLIIPALTNRTSAKLLRGIIALAASLRIRTVAEAVETWEQAFFLEAAGIDYGQGWYWSKAVPPEQVEALIISGIPRSLRQE